MRRSWNEIKSDLEQKDREKIKKSGTETVSNLSDSISQLEDEVL